MSAALLKSQHTWLNLQLIPAAISGLLMAAIFPPFDLGWLGFVALVPMSLFVERRPFASGLTCGLFFFAPLLYWLNIVMTTYGGLAPFFSAAAWLILCVYLSLYFGAVTWCAVLFQRRLHLPSFISFPLLWVAFEYLRGHLFTGFPWGLLGYAAIDMPQLRQVADLCGVYGLSLLFVLVNAVLALILQRRHDLQAVVALVCCLLLVGGALLYGNLKISKPQVKRPSLTVGLVQGNVAQEHKWDRKYRQKTLDKYRALSLSAAERGVDLLVWPEAATPFYLQDESFDSQQVRRLTQEADSFLLLGGPSYQVQADGRYRYHNSAFLFNSAGEDLGRSDKIHLVPFGEYVPLGRLLFFINKLVTGVGDFTPGTVKPLALNGHDLGVLICYEAIFPALARDYVRQGSDLLVNLTNDAWFGRSSAPRQLLDMTRMRAIENRIWVVRAANTGISAVIGPNGQAYKETPLFVTTAIVDRVELGAGKSFYRQFGDLLPWFCLFIVSVMLIWAWRVCAVHPDP